MKVEYELSVKSMNIFTFSGGGKESSKKSLVYWVDNPLCKCFKKDTIKMI